ncbi:MAG: hypothetical protein ACRC2T_02125 [Thermoguttaceae bacterium]
MFSNVGKTEDNQFQTLKNRGTEPTYSRLNGKFPPIPGYGIIFGVCCILSIVQG